jgi:hypothetical protein
MATGLPSSRSQFCLGFTNRMTDSSAAIPWITAATGCVVSVAVARFSTRPESVLGVLGVGLKALGLGVAFFFVGSLLHGFCIDALHLCKSHGDGNIAIAIGGLIATPAYWIILALCAPAESEFTKAPKNQYMAASAAAVEQHRLGLEATARCPRCHEMITVSQHAADERQKFLIIACKCARCNTNVRLRPGEASRVNPSK